MGHWDVMLLITTSRVLEFAGILLLIVFVFNKVKTKYIFINAGIVLSSIMISLSGFLFKEYFYYIAVGDFLLTLVLLLGLTVYVFTHPEKTKEFVPPEDSRCPVCNVLITNDEQICTLRVGNYTYFFDSCDHLIKLFKDLDFFIEKGSILKGKFKDIYVKTKDTDRWKKLENAKIVLEGDTYYAYENPPADKELLNTKELMDKVNQLTDSDRA